MTDGKLRNGAGCVRHLCGLSAYKMNREANDCECFPCNPCSPHSLAPRMCHAQCTATTPLLVTHSDFCHSHLSRQKVTQQPSSRTGLKEKRMWSHKYGVFRKHLLETEWNLWVKSTVCPLPRDSPPVYSSWGGVVLDSPVQALGFTLASRLVHLQQMTKV